MGDDFPELDHIATTPETQAADDLEHDRAMQRMIDALAGAGESVQANPESVQ
jgi:hypothetical protein